MDVYTDDIAGFMNAESTQNNDAVNDVWSAYNVFLFLIYIKIDKYLYLLQKS